MAKPKQSLSWDGDVLMIEYPRIGKSFSVNIADYDESIHEAALKHGFAQKYGDAASGGEADEKYDEVQKIHESLLAGEWKRTASPDTSGIVIEAVSRLKGLDREKVARAVEMKPEKLKEWKSNAKVKAEIAKIHAERAQARVEGDEEIEVDLD